MRVGEPNLPVKVTCDAWTNHLAPLALERNAAYPGIEAFDVAGRYLCHEGVVAGY